MTYILQRSVLSVAEFIRRNSFNTINGVRQIVSFSGRADSHFPGRRVDQLQISEGYRSLREIAQKEGMPGIFYERTYGEHSRLYGFTKVLLMTGDSHEVNQLLKTNHSSVDHFHRSSVRSGWQTVVQEVSLLFSYSGLPSTPCSSRIIWHGKLEAGSLHETHQVSQNQYFFFIYVNVLSS